MLHLTAWSAASSCRGRPSPSPADRRNLWVAVRAPAKGKADTIEHYDPAGKPLPGRHFIGAGINAITLGGGALWVSPFRDNHILRMDLRTGRLRQFSQLIVPASALAWGAGYLWGVVNTDGTLISINPRTGRPHFRTVAHRPWKLAVTGGRVFIASGNDDTLLVVNPKTMETEKRLHMPFNPYAVTADARHVWVTGLGDDTVTRVDVR
jgi:DNA-binding beta-propeller fold protein YncE